MQFTEYQHEAYQNLKTHTDLKDEILDYVVSLSEEVGEVASIIKHHYYGQEDINIEELAKEIGDVLWYLSALSSSTNINLDTIAKINIGKLKHRYNNSFSVDKSKARHENELKYTQTEDYKNLLSNLKLK